jgi:hypothetical protein
MVASAAVQIAFRAAARLIAVVCATARGCTLGGVLLLFAAGVLGCILDLGSACWTDAVSNATAVLHYGSAAAAGAWTLSGPATQFVWQHFPGLPKGPVCALGAAEGIATNAVASALGGNHSSASDTTLAAAMDCASGGSSGGSGSGGDDGVIRRITVIDQQGNTFEFRLEGPKGVLTVITDVDREGDTLILRGLHVYGADRATGSGANPGHTPRSITIKVR